MFTVCVGLFVTLTLCFVLRVVYLLLLVAVSFIGCGWGLDVYGLFGGLGEISLQGRVWAVEFVGYVHFLWFGFCLLIWVTRVVCWWRWLWCLGYFGLGVIFAW